MRAAGVAGFMIVTLLAVPSCGDSAVVDAPAAPENPVLHEQAGDATYYAHSFQGDLTASGRKLDNKRAVAAHRSYPFGTVARVTNLRNGKLVNVVIVDRGPYGKNRREGAIIDLSRSAAQNLGMMRDGQVEVLVEVLAWGDGAYLHSRFGQGGD